MADEDILSSITFVFCPLRLDGIFVMSLYVLGASLSASTNQSPGFVDVCSLCSDLPGDAESIGNPKVRVLGAILGASTNQSPGFVDVCSLCSDLPGDAESIGNPNSEMTTGESVLQNESEEAQSDLPKGFRGGFSVGDGERTGRFVIRLTFPGGELPDQSLEVTSSMSVPTLQRCLDELMGSRRGTS